MKKFKFIIVLFLLIVILIACYPSCESKGSNCYICNKNGKKELTCYTKTPTMVKTPTPNNTPTSIYFIPTEDLYKYNKSSKGIELYYSISGGGFKFGIPLDDESGAHIPLDGSSILDFGPGF